MEPSHESLTAAVAAFGDPELASWVASPSSYILREAERPELAHHELWFVIPMHVRPPMSFYAARSTGGQEVLVTTGNAEAVDTIVRAESLTDDALMTVAFDLLRPQGRHLTLEGGQVARTGGRIDLHLQVTDRVAGPRQWHVILDGENSRFQA